MEESSSENRPAGAKLSKTPSWIMLGFVLGALVVWSLPHRETAPRPIIMASPERPVIPAPRAQLTTVEAVFIDWAEYAVWDRDTTQVAMWNAGSGDFSDYYEVRRQDGNYFFRSISRLTNRIVRHGKPSPPECPLRFTETDAQYREWREQGRVERPVEDVRPSYAPSTPAAPKAEIEKVAPIVPSMETGSVGPAGNAAASNPRK